MSNQVEKTLLSDPRVRKFPEWLQRKIKELLESNDKLAYDLHLQKQETESESRWAKVYLDNYKDAQDIMRQTLPFITDSALRNRMSEHTR